MTHNSVLSTRGGAWSHCYNSSLATFLPEEESASAGRLLLLLLRPPPLLGRLVLLPPPPPPPPTPPPQWLPLLQVLLLPLPLPLQPPEGVDRSRKDSPSAGTV